MQRFLVTGSCISEGQIQWAPSTAGHDPNPPIMLENPPAAGTVLYFSSTLLMMGVGG